MNVEKKISVFEKTWFTILMLIVFFPVGLFTMFKYKKFTKKARTIIASVYVIMFIFYLVEETGTNKVENQSSNQPQSSIDKSTEGPIETAQSTTDLITKAIPKSINNITQINYVDGLDGDKSPVVFIMDMKDNLTNNYMFKGAYLNAKDIITAVDSKVGDKINSYQFVFNFPLVDKYGNSEVEKVLSFDYSKETIDKINWNNITTDNFIDLSENQFIHPALTK